MSRSRAYAKINLALVVGPLRPDAKHEVVTVLQRVGLYDDVEVEPADGFAVEGFPHDTLVRAALEALASAADVRPSWRARIEKRIPVSAGLGGGSADGAAALELANVLLPEPLTQPELHEVAAGVGADVPFFLREGPQLATGDGSELAPIELPRDYLVLIVLPDRQTKESTEAVYRAFDERAGAEGFEERRTALLDALASVTRFDDLAGLPRNDLASSPLAVELERLGALRADVTGAGPAVYGLFQRDEEGKRAEEALRESGRTWLLRPVPVR